MQLYQYLIKSWGNHLTITRSAHNEVEATDHAECIGREGIWHDEIFYAPGGIREVHFMGEVKNENT